MFMNLESLHILLADDDQAYCIMMQKALTTRGHNVTISHNGEDTITLLQKGTFDVVLLDYKMEGTNGINVLQWMYGKKMEIPVVLITAYGADDINEEAFKWGAKEFFIKGEMDVVRLPIMAEQLFSRYCLRKQHTKNSSR